MTDHPTRRGFTLAALSLAASPLVRPSPPATPTQPPTKPIGSSFVIEIDSHPHRITFTPAGGDSAWEGKPGNRYSGESIEDESTTGPSGLFLVERLTDEDVPDPEPHPSDHPRPIGLAEGNPRFHDRLPSLDRLWKAEDAARCRLCTWRCNAKRIPDRPDLARCQVDLPLTLAAAPLETLAMFQARSPDEHSQYDNDDGAWLMHNVPQFNGRR